MKTIDEMGDSIIDGLVTATVGVRKSHRQEVLEMLQGIHDGIEKMVEAIDIPDEEFFHLFSEEKPKEESA